MHHEYEVVLYTFCYVDFAKSSLISKRENICYFFNVGGIVDVELESSILTIDLCRLMTLTQISIPSSMY